MFVDCVSIFLPVHCSFYFIIKIKKTAAETPIPSTQLQRLTVLEVFSLIICFFVVVVFLKYIYKVQRRPVFVMVSFLYRITGCKYFSDLGTDERWTLLEAQLGCSGSVYPGCPADADLQGGIEQPEDDTNSYGSCDGHSCRTRPQPDR